MVAREAEGWKEFRIFHVDLTAHEEHLIREAGIL